MANSRTAAMSTSCFLAVGQRAARDCRVMPASPGRLSTCGWSGGGWAAIAAATAGRSRVSALAATISEEPGGDALDDAVEPGFEAGGAGQVETRLDVGGQFRVPVARFGEVALQALLPLLVGEPGALPELTPGRLAAGEPAQVVVEYRHHLGSGLPAEAVPAEDLHAELGVAAGVRAQPGLNAQERYPRVVLVRHLSGAGYSAQVSPPVAGRLRQLHLSRHSVEHQLVEVGFAADMPVQRGGA